MATHASTLPATDGRQSFKVAITHEQNIRIWYQHNAELHPLTAQHPVFRGSISELTRKNLTLSRAFFISHFSLDLFLQTVSMTMNCSFLAAQLQSNQLSNVGGLVRCPSSKIPWSKANTTHPVFWPWESVDCIVVPGHDWANVQFHQILNNV